MATVLIQRLLGGVEWGRSYSWDISFVPSPPEPFKIFFPASEVEENILVPDTYSTPAGMLNITVPQSVQEKTISLTFYDDQDGTLENWLKDWYDEIYNINTQTVATLQEATRIITVERRDIQKQLNSTQSNSYLVFPRSPLQFVGSSDSSVRQHTQEFVIAGTIS